MAWRSGESRTEPKQNRSQNCAFIILFFSSRLNMITETTYLHHSTITRSIPSITTSRSIIMMKNIIINTSLRLLQAGLSIIVWLVQVITPPGEWQLQRRDKMECWQVGFIQFFFRYFRDTPVKLSTVIQLSNTNTLMHFINLSFLSTWREFLILICKN